MKYRYLIYKIYSWTANKKGDTPVVNTILALTTAHFFQLASLLILIDKLITPLPWLLDINKKYLSIGAVVYIVCFYFAVYNKDRWAAYVEEFKNESPEQRRRGNILAICYLIGSILLFFITIPIAFTFNRFK